MFAFGEAIRIEAPETMLTIPLYTSIFTLTVIAIAGIAAVRHLILTEKR